MAIEQDQTQPPSNDAEVEQTSAEEQQAVDDGDDDGDFSDAFSERATDPGKQRQKEPQDGGAPSPEEEPEQSRSQDAPPQGAAKDTTASGTNASAFDPWSGLSPEQKSHFERLQASERSQRGRVSALTRKMNEQRPAPAPTPAPKQDRREEQSSEDSGSERQSQEGNTVSDLDKRLQEAADEYGDVVGPLVDALADVRAEVATLKGFASKVEVENDSQELARSYAALEEAHPDYADYGPGSDFEAWLGDQPAKVVELAGSYDPREVSLALTLFKTERSAETAKLAGEEGAGNEGASTATDAKRARQLDGSRQVTSRGAPAASGTPNDFDSAFDARARQHAK
jgi:hypothetical protein